MDCEGVVGFILTLLGQVFSSILYKRDPPHQQAGDDDPKCPNGIDDEKVDQNTCGQQHQAQRKTNDAETFIW